MSNYSPKHPSRDSESSRSGSHTASRAKSSGGDKKKQKILIIAIIAVLVIVIVAALVLIFIPGAESGFGKIFSGTDSYVPETQNGTTIISQYYQNGVLPTSGDRHDVNVINGGGRNASDLEGKWSLDDVTIYEFDGLGRGIMLTGVDNYTFLYSAEDGKLCIDYDIDGGTDKEYDYTIDGDTLTPTSGSKTYVFTKEEIQ